MARWSFKKSTWTTNAVADTVNYTDGAYVAIQGGSSTQKHIISEVYVGGQATSSAPQYLIFSRDSTVGVTLTALSTGESNAALDPSTAALAAPPLPFTASTTKPQRSASLGLLNLTFNAFGGIVRWVAGLGNEIGLLGNTASLGEVSLSGYTGTTAGLVGSHIIYETL